MMLFFYVSILSFIRLPINQYKIMQKTVLFIFAIVLFSCKNEAEVKTLKVGDYRGVFEVLDKEKLPFNFEVLSDHKLVISNSNEIIEVDEIVYRNDSVFIMLPYFETYFAGVLDDDNLKGKFFEESRDRIVPFSAEYNNDKRFVFDIKRLPYSLDGSWEMVFSANIEADRYIAKGVFEQRGNFVRGTIETTTGDYRFLEGIVDGNQMKLSTFDGAHAFLFKATLTDSTMSGMFYSGNHFKEPFIAKRNANYELPDADNLTFLKKGYDTLTFSFPDLDGKMVALSDEKFKNKVVLVQAMGSYCPNCLDESKFYSKFYKANKHRGIEIVALAFENAKTETKAIKGITRMKDRVGINYPILLAQYGTNSKQKAQEKLPMLNHVLSYPTTIYIDKKGNVRKIHTGFNGPATGDKYEHFKIEFNNFMDELLSE